MSVFIKEESGMNLTDKIGETIYLRCGRSNNLIVDNKVFLHDVRAIHFNNNNAEFISYNKVDESDRQSVTVYNVESIIVESVYWSKKLFFDE